MCRARREGASQYGGARWFQARQGFVPRRVHREKRRKLHNSRQRWQRRFMLATAMIVGVLLTIALPARNAWADDSHVVHPDTIFVIASGKVSSEAEITVNEGDPVYVARAWSSSNVCGNKAAEKKKWKKKPGFASFHCVAKRPHELSGSRWGWVAGQGTDGIDPDMNGTRVQTVSFTHDGVSKTFVLRIKGDPVRAEGEDYKGLKDDVKKVKGAKADRNEIGMSAGPYLSREESWAFNFNVSYAPWADDTKEDAHIYFGSRLGLGVTDLQIDTSENGFEVEDDNSRMYHWSGTFVVGGRVPLGDSPLRLGLDVGPGLNVSHLPHSVAVYEYPRGVGNTVPIDSGMVSSLAGDGRVYMDIVIDKVVLRGGVGANVHSELVATGGGRDTEVRITSRADFGAAFMF